MRLVQETKHILVELMACEISAMSAHPRRTRELVPHQQLRMKPKSSRKQYHVSTSLRNQKALETNAMSAHPRGMCHATHPRGNKRLVKLVITSLMNQ